MLNKFHYIAITISPSPDDPRADEYEAEAAKAEPLVTSWLKTLFPENEWGDFELYNVPAGGMYYLLVPAKVDESEDDLISKIEDALGDVLNYSEMHTAEDEGDETFNERKASYRQVV